MKNLDFQVFFLINHLPPASLQVGLPSVSWIILPFDYPFTACKYRSDQTDKKYLTEKMNFDVHCLQKKNTLSIFINAMTIKIGQAKYSWFLKSGNSKSKMLLKRTTVAVFVTI